MLPINIALDKTFFITGLGRSGTKFLAELLDNATNYHVIHEGRFDGRWADKVSMFPMHRFVANRMVLRRGMGYGEVNSYLRFALDPGKVGLEASIAKRGIIFRDPKDVISSTMNRQQRTIQDFEAVCHHTLSGYNNLLGLADHKSLRFDWFEFKAITRNKEEILRVIEWIGLEGIDLGQIELDRKVNVNKADWFPKSEHWERERKSTYQRVYGGIVSNNEPNGLSFTGEI